jgi:hypothetical protein
MLGTVGSLVVWFRFSEYLEYFVYQYLDHLDLATSLLRISSNQWTSASTHLCNYESTYARDQVGD